MSGPATPLADPPAGGGPPPHLQLAKGEHETPDAILKQALKQRRLKYTAERREVLREVLGTHEHFDANALHELLRRHGSRVSKATVYRTLSLLREIGILREAFHGQHGAHYEHVYGHTHHEHMLCLTCGKVLEFDSGSLEQSQEEACRRLHFTPVRHHLQVFGYCAECQGKKVAPKAGGA